MTIGGTQRSVLRSSVRVYPEYVFLSKKPSPPIICTVMWRNPYHPQNFKDPPRKVHFHFASKNPADYSQRLRYSSPRREVMMATYNSEPDIVGTYSDAQLSMHIARCRQKQHLDQGRSTRLIEISRAYLSKRYFSYEELEDTLLAIDLAQSLNVRTPRVRRIVPVKGFYECIFDRARVGNLMDIWVDLGWIITIHLGFQLRSSERFSSRFGNF